MGNKQREKIESLEMQVETIKKEKQEISDLLKAQDAGHQTEINKINDESKQAAENKKIEHETKINELNVTIEGLKKELKETKTQLDRKELKKLAEAFDEQEKINKSDQKKWLVAVIVVAGILIAYAVGSIFLTANKPWLERLSYYAIDVILISGAWFCIAQFSESTRLRYDYGNRKTLAQTFQNILNNLSEDENIRSKFIEKATDVLCAPSGSGAKEPVLTKKVLKDVAEIIGSVASK